jgi:hypothetical protein
LSNEAEIRLRPVEVEWVGKCARLSIGGELWSEVEWSEKHQKWCVQDAEGRCLAHHSPIYGEADDKEGAIALAEGMIRFGQLPSPEAARQLRKDRLRQQRERRARQPAQAAKRRLRDEATDLFRAQMEAEFKERSANDETPFYELIADVFDLADPELWKRNSFARLRDRLVLSLTKEVAGIEYDLRNIQARATKKQLARGAPYMAKREARLTRARQLLSLLHPDDDGSAP